MAFTTINYGQFRSLILGKHLSPLEVKNHHISKHSPAHKIFGKVLVKFHTLFQ